MSSDVKHTAEPSNEAMRSAVKWHGAMDLSGFGIAILARAFDDHAALIAPSPTFMEQHKKLVEAAEAIADGHMDISHTAIILSDNSDQARKIVRELFDALAALKGEA